MQPLKASKDTRKHPRRFLERLLAIMVDPEDSKKACWRPRIAQEGLLEPKVSPRSCFCAIFGSILGACFGTCSVPNLGPRLASFLAPFWSSTSDNKSAESAFNMALEGTKKRQDELEDAMHQKIQRSIEILQTMM